MTKSEESKMNRHDDMALCYLILKQTDNIKNDHIPSRIFYSIKTVQHTRFKQLITLLQSQLLIEIIHDENFENRSKNKFYLTEKGKRLINLYQEMINILDFSYKFPEMDMSDFY